MTVLMSPTKLLFSALSLAASYARAQQQGAGLDNLNGATNTTSSGNGMPATSDNAAGGSDDNRKVDTVGLVNYYFVFLALVVCIAGAAAYMMYKRKRKHGAFLRSTRGHALQQDVDDTRSRGRYWEGRWRSTDHGTEEGLNEQGEAPPPYRPKTRQEETNPNGLTVPMQTLSRGEAGLNKPPDYYASPEVHPVEGDTHGSGVGSSQPSPPQQSHIQQ